MENQVLPTIDLKLSGKINKKIKKIQKVFAENEIDIIELTNTEYFAMKPPSPKDKHTHFFECTLKIGVMPRC